ncbi:MAG: zinc-ribbon domain-containing protein [Blastocatellia bacterium]
MFCPRCGAQITETIKFCVSCGLPMQQISGYVHSGGTAPLAQPQATAHVMLTPEALKNTPEGVKLRQKRTLTILAFIFGVPASAILGDQAGVEDFIVPLMPFVMIIGIVWASFRYKNEMAELAQRYTQPGWSPPQPAFPQTGSQPALPPQQPNTYPDAYPGAYQSPQSPPAQPAYRPVPSAVQPDTNPLDRLPRPSVTEGETRRLP